MIKPRYLKISGHNDIVRDSFSNGVLNTNIPAIESAKRRKKESLSKLIEAREQKLTIQKLSKEVEELKQLVGQLLNR